MGVAAWLTRTLGSSELERSSPLALEEWVNQRNSLLFGGHLYGYGLAPSQPGASKEEVLETFAGYVNAAYRANGVVAACMLARESLFAEARFQWRRFRQGRPGALFGNEELGVLERPWPNATTGDLLVRMEQDSSLAGNFFGRRRPNGLARMRPDWVTIMLGSNTDPDNPGWALDAEVIGYAYHPGGAAANREPVLMLVDEVCHYAPRPDPERRFVGMSLLTSAVREIQADSQATQQKSLYFEKGGPNVAMTLPIQDAAKFRAAAEEFRRQHGLQDHRWLVMQPGATFEKLGSDLKEMDFKVVQGAGETRIAAALGVPPVIVGLSEGLEAATYSNYALAMRRFADLTMRPLWRKAAGSLQTVLDAPPDAELWYDDRDIPALKDDIKLRADSQGIQSRTIRTLLDAGFTADSVIAAVESEDWNVLEHSGMFSVQLQKPGPETAGVNGNGGGGGDGVALVEEAERVLGGAT